MNWQDPTDERRVILGVMKLPAKLRGPQVPPLFINPGVSEPPETMILEHPPFADTVLNIGTRRIGHSSLEGTRPRNPEDRGCSSCKRPR